MLAAFCWAVPDERYEYWILQKLWLYYIFSAFSVALFTIGLGIGGYYYMYGIGLYSFFGMGVITYLLQGSLLLIFAICSSFYYIDLKFYKKPVILGSDKGSHEKVEQAQFDFRGVQILKFQ